MTALVLRVRPGSATERLDWDRWRGCWTVACPAPARDGAANSAVLGILAERLGLSRANLRWRTGQRSREKVVEVEGLSAEEVDRRLRARSSCDDGGSDRAGGAPRRATR